MVTREWQLMNILLNSSHEYENVTFITLFKDIKIFIKCSDFLKQRNIKDETLYLKKKIEPFEERRDIWYIQSKTSSDTPSRDSSRRRSESRYGNRRRHWKRRDKRGSLSGEDECRRSRVSHRTSRWAAGSWRSWSRARSAACWRTSGSRPVSWARRVRRTPASEREPVAGEQSEREPRRARRRERGSIGSGRGFSRRLRWLRRRARRRGRDGRSELGSRRGRQVRCWVWRVRGVDWLRRCGRGENRGGWGVKWSFSSLLKATERDREKKGLYELWWRSQNLSVTLSFRFTKKGSLPLFTIFSLFCSFYRIIVEREWEREMWLKENKRFLTLAASGLFYRLCKLC